MYACLSPPTQMFNRVSLPSTRFTPGISNPDVVCFTATLVRAPAPIFFPLYLLYPTNSCPRCPQMKQWPPLRCAPVIIVIACTIPTRLPYNFLLPESLMFSYDRKTAPPECLKLFY